MQARSKVCLRLSSDCTFQRWTPGSCFNACLHLSPMHGCLGAASCQWLHPSSSAGIALYHCGLAGVCTYCCREGRTALLKPHCFKTASAGSSYITILKTHRHAGSQRLDRPPSAHATALNSSRPGPRSRVCHHISYDVCSLFSLSTCGMHSICSFLQRFHARLLYPRLSSLPTAAARCLCCWLIQSLGPIVLPALMSSPHV